MIAVRVQSPGGWLVTRLERSLGERRQWVSADTSRDP